tara:strand:- start:4027 stop:4938 length:912 start_codon:yes stop_codon:yes gene_type:complete
MKWILSSLGVLFIIALFFIASISNPSISNGPMSRLPVVECSPVGPYVTKVKLDSGITVRLLILKHCFERVAANEERDIIKVMNLAADKGLNIKDIGGHFVNGDGKIDRHLWKTCSLSGLKDFLVQQMRTGAESGDTLVVYTTGHGSKSGYLAQFGKRTTIMKAFAEAAEEAQQETLWWQSSCYAAAGLLPMESLSETQQELLTMVTSSNANRVSYWGDQTEAMKRVFIALAEESPELDQDQDGTVVAGELSKFLKKVKKEDIVFAISPEEPIFGLDWPNRIPIRDMDGNLFNAPDKYIPKPIR